MSATATATTTDSTIHSLNIRKETPIDAPVKIVWESVLEQLGPGAEFDGGKPFPMKFEAWPGGRWWRDLGDGAGHLWGHVQVIKPFKVIEITGPMFMSYAAASHIQYKFAEQGTGTLLTMVHDAIGHIPKDQREGVNHGWQHVLDQIKSRAEKRK